MGNANCIRDNDANAIRDNDVSQTLTMPGKHRPCLGNTDHASGPSPLRALCEGQSFEVDPVKKTVLRLVFNSYLKLDPKPF
jgi:hypothetical protein